uniref:Uncharacterized protein n=1 Tax=Solanum lycopersicum TaxID=4081 RepID=A0A3Q7ECI9_SOLLC
MERHRPTAAVARPTAQDGDGHATGGDIGGATSNTEVRPTTARGLKMALGSTGRAKVRWAAAVGESWMVADCRASWMA